MKYMLTGATTDKSSRTGMYSRTAVACETIPSSTALQSIALSCTLTRASMAIANRRGAAGVGGSFSGARAQQNTNDITRLLTDIKIQGIASRRTGSARPKPTTPRIIDQSATCVIVMI